MCAQNVQVYFFILKDLTGRLINSREGKCVLVTHTHMQTFTLDKFIYCFKIFVYRSCVTQNDDDDTSRLVLKIEIYIKEKIVH